jgi:hypothetical protein
MVVPNVVCNFVSFQTKKCALCAYNFIEENWQSFEKPNKVSVKHTMNHWTPRSKIKCWLMITTSTKFTNCKKNTKLQPWIGYLGFMDISTEYSWILIWNSDIGFQNIHAPILSKTTKHSRQSQNRHKQLIHYKNPGMLCDLKQHPCKICWVYLIRCSLGILWL